MKEESRWPKASYAASLIGAVAVLILRLYAFQKGSSHFSGGRMLPLVSALSPFLFGVLVIHFNTNPRAIRLLSIVIILLAAGTILRYCHAIFGMVGIESATALAMVPLYQFVILGITAAVARFLPEEKGSHHRK